MKNDDHLCKKLPICMFLFDNIVRGALPPPSGPPL